jgi:magnesium chelatase subunit D
VPVVDLPLGATEDRVCGSIDIQRALSCGVKAFEPGLLARANRGFLYIDEVNLLEDHLVDLLLDVAVTGRNKVERESISIEHPARFVLIGSGNPEEGELRPQLLDRFGLYVEVQTENDPDQRVEIVEKRQAFDHNPENFRRALESEQQELQRKITRAHKAFANVKVERELLRQIATLCSALKVEGHRGELTIMRSAMALAAFEGRKALGEEDVRRVAPMSLRHRLRRDALQETASTLAVEQALEKLFSGETRSTGATAARDDSGRQPAADDDDPMNRPRPGGPSRRGDPNGNSGSDSRRELSSSPANEALLPKLKLSASRQSKDLPNSQGHRRQTGPRHTSYNSQRGRYARALALSSAGASIAVVATLRASLGQAMAVQDRDATSVKGRSLTPIAPAQLRFKQFARKNGTLFIFAVDASGSMALNRISQAKGALYDLLRQSYINRDSVAIVTFKGKTAEVALPPSRSMVRARRVLDTLTIGGGTPLSAGLACAIELAHRSRSQSRGEVVLLLFTDGHANVPLRADGVTDRAARRRLIEAEVKRLGSEMRKAGMNAVVVDTQKAFAPNGNVAALAEGLGARYVQMKRSGIAGS